MDKIQLVDSWRLSLMCADLREMRRKYTSYKDDEYQAFSLAISSINRAIGKVEMNNDPFGVPE